MHRLLFFAAVCLGLLILVPVAARAQTSSAPRGWTNTPPAVEQPPVEQPDARPPEDLPQKTLIPESIRLAGDEDLGSVADTLTEAQILRRISRVYRYQADILAAEADEDHEHVEGLLELAMTEISILSQQQDITERPRFRELYRSIVTEYERYYGIASADLSMPYGDIFQFRADMFAWIDAPDEPLLEDITIPTLAPMETVVPMTMNPIVEQTMKYFLTKKRDVLERWMGRADTYFPMVEQIFREEGVPDELKYLALVESGLNPRARSWAAAVGMWQFIAATGRAYGLQVNAWADERMDPEKATRAAARHLKDLYAQYGNNWHVALAGYNCSPRCIKRAIARAGGSLENPPSYWDMYPYLPRETRGYVPQFIAFSLIMSNPEAFGLAGVPRGPQYAYDLVPVQGVLSLQDIAAMVDADVDMIRALNPELRRESLPPSNAPYPLRLPKGTYARFAAAFENLPEETRQPVGEYVIRRGDSLGKIAARYGVSVQALKQTNGLRSNTIHPGQRLIVPVATYSEPATLADARPMTVEYGPRTIRPIDPQSVDALATPVAHTRSDAPPIIKASTTAPAAANATGPDEEEEPAEAAESTTQTRVVYQVRRGDTLGRIAQKYGVSVRDLQQWNNLRGTNIRSGQRLYLYASDEAPSEPERVEYTVRRGDSLSKIAQQYSVTVSSIRSWNNLKSTRIRSGQRLTIYPGKATPNYVVYKVRRGDSLGKIATRYGTTVTKLKEWNNLNRNTIYPGQRLKIYKSA